MNFCIFEDACCLLRVSRLTKLLESDHDLRTNGFQSVSSHKEDLVYASQVILATAIINKSSRTIHYGRIDYFQANVVQIFTQDIFEGF